MPRHSYEQGLKVTVRWYLENLDRSQQLNDRAGYCVQRIGAHALAMAAG